MNREIRHLYNSLNAASKTQLRVDFEQAPKMLRYIDLLETNQLIPTTKAVNYIYKGVLSTVAHQVLVNRFYKLRTKMRLWLLKQLKNNPICFIPEEQEFALLRWMVVKNEQQYAYEQLLVLEERCWTNNLFELLPEVLSLLQRSAHACDIWDRKMELVYVEKVDLANELRYHFQRINNQLFYLKNNLDQYKAVLDSIRRRIKAYRAYPRFALLYHFIAFIIGVYGRDLVQQKGHALTRHLNSFRNLRKKYPSMPVSDVEPYYQERLEASFYPKEAVFWFYKNDLSTGQK
jgi:hypothetical protein